MQGNLSALEQKFDPEVARNTIMAAKYFEHTLKSIHGKDFDYETSIIGITTDPKTGKESLSVTLKKYGHD